MDEPWWEPPVIEALFQGKLKDPSACSHRCSGCPACSDVQNQSLPIVSPISLPDVAPTGLPDVAPTALGGGVGLTGWTGWTG